MLIIEFCGTPGCGKTTLCDAVEQELQASGYPVKNLQKRKLPVTYADKIGGMLERFCFRHAFYNRRLKKVLRSIRPYLAEDSRINWTERILEASYRIKKAEREGMRVGLFDEGCLQFITSVFHGKTVTQEVQSLITVLLEEVYKNRTLIFDCQIDAAENYCRLVRRNRADDRFLAGDKEESLRLLKQKRDNINLVLEMVEGQSKGLLRSSACFPEKEFVLGEIEKKEKSILEKKE